MTKARKTDVEKEEKDRLATASTPQSAKDEAVEASMKNQPAKQRDNRLDSIEQADDRTEESAEDRARNIGAETRGDPGELLSQPVGDGNYVEGAKGSSPLRGNEDSSGS